MISWLLFGPLKEAETISDVDSVSSSVTHMLSFAAMKNNHNDLPLCLSWPRNSIKLGEISFHGYQDSQ
jgi:hypothetical protein